MSISEKTHVLLMLNYKSIDSFQKEAVDGLWGIGSLPSAKIRPSVKYIIACCNLNHEKSEFASNDSCHGSAYIIAKVEKSVPLETQEKEGAKRHTKRCRVLFREYAYLDKEVIWNKQTNILRYTSLEELLDGGYKVDLNNLDWISISESTIKVDKGDVIRPLTKEQATECLALYYGVDPSKVKLTVELV